MTGVQIQVEVRRITLDIEDAVRRAMHKQQQAVEATKAATRCVIEGVARIEEIYRIGGCGNESNNDSSRDPDES